MTATVDLAAVLRGDLASGDELRQALAAMTSEGYVIVPRAELVDLAAARPDDGTIAYRVVILARLLEDTDLLAEILVDAFSREPAIGTGQLEQVAA